MKKSELKQLIREVLDETRFPMQGGKELSRSEKNKNSKVCPQCGSGETRINKGNNTQDCGYCSHKEPFSTYTNEEDVDEVSTSGAAGPVMIPMAFAGNKNKKNRRRTSQTSGMKIIGNMDERGDDV